MTDLARKTSVPRHEDPRLLAGNGKFTGDWLPPGTAHVAFVRSPHAHARIVRLDASRALSARGVIAVLTAADLAADGVPPSAPRVPQKRPDGSNAAVTPRPLLVGERVRHIGEPVAMVVAETAIDAVDAAEQVEVEYDALPVVVSCPAALAAESVAVWDE
jgi:carbon-monoxide dehydrogenase large subunit